MKNKENTVDIRPFTRQLFHGNIAYLVIMVLSSILLIAANLLVSYLIQVMIDMIAGAETGYSFSGIILMSALVILLIVMAITCLYFSRPKFISKAVAQYKTYVFGEISKKSISAFSGENTSTYISALSNDINSIETGYLSNFYLILKEIFGFVGAIVMMFCYSPLLTVISIAFAALPLLAAILTGNMVAKAEKEVSSRNESYMQTLRESLSGFSVIKSFKAEARLFKLFSEQTYSVATAKEKRMKKAILVQLFATTAGCILQLGVFIVGAYLALSGSDISAGSVLIFVQLLNWVISPIESLPNAFAECKASLELIRKLATALNKNTAEDGTHTIEVLQSGISLKNISFSYEPDKPILDDISFDFKTGKSYCIVGASGSGKSTLLQLLTNPAADYNGEVLYDNVNIKDISVASLYDVVSVTEQKVFLWNSTIRDNITMFGNFPENEVNRAASLSGLSALINDRGENYLCGENGNNLSGGEKQRISIARSLLKKSSVLLADEATAALDKKTAFEVMNAILDLDDTTRIIVTHSLDKALLSRFDCIITLKQGSIIESGSFEDLVSKKGYFYSLYTISQ